MKPAILLIGHGAIASQVRAAAARTGLFKVGAVLVRPERQAAVAAELPGVAVISNVQQLADKPTLAVECASHAAVAEHGPEILSKGIDLVLASNGALADDSVRTALEAAARKSGAKLILSAGAIPGIDALSAAQLGGLDFVSYTSRKPPLAWRGTPAEREVDLDKLREPTTFYVGTARAAARDYPKNANVAATVAVATLGFDRTEVRMIADPHAVENIHEIEARGAFGEMKLSIRGRPLPDNPKTSALAAHSVVRAILNRFRSVEI